MALYSVYIHFLWLFLFSSGEPGLVDRVLGCSPCTQEVEGSTPTGGTCPNDFSDPIDQDIRIQWALSWKKWYHSGARWLQCHWTSAVASAFYLKPAKLCMCTQNTTNTTRTNARRRMCAAMVPYRWDTRGTSLRELEYTHTHTHVSFFISQQPRRDQGHKHEHFIVEKILGLVIRLSLSDMFYKKKKKKK